MTKEEQLKHLKALHGRITIFDEDDRKQKDALEKTIETLSQEPKSGEWIERQNIECSDLETAVNLRWRYECSECGYKVRSKCRFCPSCGADMREDKE